MHAVHASLQLYMSLIGHLFTLTFPVFKDIKVSRDE